MGFFDPLLLFFSWNEKKVAIENRRYWLPRDFYLLHHLRPIVPFVYVEQVKRVLVSLCFATGYYHYHEYVNEK